MGNIKSIATKTAAKSKVLWKQTTVAVAAFLVSATGCESGGLKGCSRDHDEDRTAVVAPAGNTNPESTPGNETPTVPDAPHIAVPAIFIDGTQDGMAGSGDSIILTFTEDVVVNSATMTDFHLPVAGDSLQNGGVIAGPESNQVTIKLGPNSSLKTRGLFSPEKISTNDPSGIDVSATLAADSIESTSDGDDAVSFTPVDIVPGFAPGSLGFSMRYTEAVAVGDLDGDGRLDVVVGNAHSHQNETYLQNGPSYGRIRIGQTYTAWYISTHDVALGDLDGDGDLDLIEANSWNANYARLNNGAGSFGSALQFGDAQGVTNAVVLGDLDRDGDLDVVMGNDEGNPNTVWKNDGSGTGNFLGTVAMNFLGNSNTRGLALGDINGDGYPDLVSGNWGEENNIWINNADKPWTGFHFSGKLQGTRKTQDVELADLDGDGDLDLVAGNRDGEANTFWKNDGTGDFGSAPAYSFGESDTYDLAVSDLDADGDLDVVSGNYVQPNHIWLNDGTGSFSDSPQSLGSESTKSIAIGDMDGDGDLDLVTGNCDHDDYTQIWNGSLSGTWGTATLTDSEQSSGEGKTTCMAIGDINGDGAPDFVAGNNQGEKNSSWISDGNGNFGSTPFETFGDGKACSVALGDMDGDGDLDLVEGNSWAENMVRINDGTGKFATSASFGLTSSPTRVIALGDIDGDGDLDVVEGTSNHQANRVWLNNGSGTVFTDSGYTLGYGNAASIALGDLDRDGDLDLVIGNLNQQIEVWMNIVIPASSTIPFLPTPTTGIGQGMPNVITPGSGSGPKGFSQSTQNLGTYATKSLVLGDVNGDGILDLVAGDDGINGAAVWANDGTGTGAFFGSSPVVTVPLVGIRSLGLGDLDADGDLDLLVGRWNQANTIWENDGTGTGAFYGQVAGQTFGDPLLTHSALFCDLDRDGDLDVLEGIETSGNKFWMNR